MLTGQIVTRPTDRVAPDGKRVLVIVYGVVAVDPSSPLNAEGRQFVLSESPMSISSGNIETTIFKDGMVDRKEMTQGMRVEQVLCSSIWKT